MSVAIYNWAEASQETITAMRQRCGEEDHSFDKLELSDGKVVKVCTWCGVQV